MIGRGPEVEGEVYHALDPLQLSCLGHLVFVVHIDDILPYRISGVREHLFDCRIHRFEEFHEDNTSDDIKRQLGEDGKVDKSIGERRLVNSSHEVDSIFGLPDRYCFIVVSWFDVLIHWIDRDLVSGFGNTVGSRQMAPFIVVVSTSELHFITVLALPDSLAPMRSYYSNICQL